MVVAVVVVVWIVRAVVGSLDRGYVCFSMCL